MFKKGKKKTGGRKKGVPNRFTTFRNALIEAFESKEIDGVRGLIAWGKQPKNRGQFYALMAKMLPREIEVSGELNFASPLSEESWDERAKRVTAELRKASGGTKGLYPSDEQARANRQKIMEQYADDKLDND